MAPLMAFAVEPIVGAEDLGMLVAIDINRTWFKRIVPAVHSISNELAGQFDQTWPQGRSLFHNTQFGEKLLSFPGASADCLGDICVAFHPQHRDDGVAKCGQILRGIAFADAAGIFVKSEKGSGLFGANTLTKSPDPFSDSFLIQS